MRDIVAPLDSSAPRLKAWKARVAVHGLDGLRECFASPPTDAILKATTLLSSAVDALLAGDRGAAAAGICAAELSELLDWCVPIMGTVDHDIICWRPVDATPFPPGGFVDSGYQSRSLKDAVFRRDGWRCRYCGSRVVHPEARDRLKLLLPGIFRWTNSHGDHAAFEALSGVADHVRPHKRGGPTTPANLVTCCAACNYGKGGDFLEPLGLTDPRDRAPLPADGWDGLLRLLALPRPRLRPENQDPPPNMAVWAAYAHLLGKRARAALLAANLAKVSLASEASRDQR